MLIDVKNTRGFRFEQKLAKLSSKTNNIRDTIREKKSFPLRIYLINVSKAALLCGYVHMTK